MNSTLKNIIVLLIVMVFGFIGYYILIQDNDLQNNILRSSIDEDISASNQIFIDRGKTLAQIEINIEILQDPLFLSYRSFFSPVEDRPVGRENPFEKSGIISYSSNSF